MTLYQLIFLLVVINAVGFICMHLDKKYAMSGHKRISEASLMTIAVLGGSIGILIGMYVKRHKKRKRLFKIGVPVIIAVQVILVILFL